MARAARASGARADAPRADASAADADVASHPNPRRAAARASVGAGDAYVILNESLKDAPTDALTFEAWIKTNDDCNDGTLLSYAVDPAKYVRGGARSRLRR